MEATRANNLVKYEDEIKSRRKRTWFKSEKEKKQVRSKEYEKKLRERMSLFRHHTKTKKSLVHTFITTYGIANGKNKSMVHSEITMDDIFDLSIIDS